MNCCSSFCWCVLELTSERRSDSLHSTLGQGIIGATFVNSSEVFTPGWPEVDPAP